MRKQDGVHSHIFLVIAIALLASAGPSFGQFLVQPMRMELAVRPGKFFKASLDIQSLDPNETHTIDLSVVELTQWENGEWRVIEPNSPEDPNSPNFGFDISTLSSCKDWIRFRTPSIELPPFAMSTVDMILKVPPGIRGFYNAGILATLRPRPGATDITVILRFLVPVLAEVQGRPMRHSIELEDVGIELIEPIGGNPATTVVSMDVSNKGGTYSRLKAFAKVRGFWDGHWREVTEAEFRQTSIIPGVKFKLKTDIGRSLPSGRYRLSGVLYVDGRRAERIEKEMDFVGDTSITKVATDAPLDVLPSELLINCRPGATRTTAIKVRNVSDETVNVQTALALPRNLQGVAYGELKGDDLDCTAWLKLEPESFTLPSYKQQTIRVTAAMPKSLEALHPCYYALLGLFTTYPDGQRGGVTTANIGVTNESISAEPFVSGMKLSPALKEGSQYYIVARFGNFGPIHFTPIRCRAAVVTDTGEPRALVALSSSKSDIMLPLEVRDFSGIIDFSKFSAGTYRLAAALEYAPGERAVKQIGIRVQPQGELRVVEVVKLEGELGKEIQVQW